MLALEDWGSCLHGSRERQHPERLEALGAASTAAAFKAVRNRPCTDKRDTRKELRTKFVPLESI